MKTTIDTKRSRWVFDFDAMTYTRSPLPGTEMDPHPVVYRTEPTPFATVTSGYGRPTGPGRFWVTEPDGITFSGVAVCVQVEAPGVLKVAEDLAPKPEPTFAVGDVVLVEPRFWNAYGESDSSRRGITAATVEKFYRAHGDYEIRALDGDFPGKLCLAFPAHLEPYDVEPAPDAENPVRILGGIGPSLKTLAPHHAAAYGATPEEAAGIERAKERRENLRKVEGWLEEEFRASAAVASAWPVVQEVLSERGAQGRKWGEQNPPDGTGGAYDANMADLWRKACQREFDEGRGTWKVILLEEVYEALAEADPVDLRAELLQVAAVAVAWVEAIDRRPDVDAEA